MPSWRSEVRRTTQNVTEVKKKLVLGYTMTPVERNDHIRSEMGMYQMKSSKAMTQYNVAISIYPN